VIQKEDDNICDICGKFEKSKKLLRRHMIKHSDDRPYPCPFCPKMFKRRYEVTAHVKVKHDEPSQLNKQYECQEPDCGKKFTIPSKLEVRFCYFDLQYFFDPYDI